MVITAPDSKKQKYVPLDLVEPLGKLLCSINEQSKVTKISVLYPNYLMITHYLPYG